jgi:hypothetical protein
MAPTQSIDRNVEICPREGRFIAVDHTMRFAMSTFLERIGPTLEL